MPAEGRRRRPVAGLLGGLAFLALLTLSPHDAFAWGWYTHLQFGQDVINYAGLLPEVVRTLLVCWPHDYLYGSVVADMVMAKSLAGDATHCHRWENTLGLVDDAGDDAQRAFALGYLSHLAADTVAHNYFVPSKLVEGYSGVSTGHTAWEMRFDQRVRGGVTSLARDLLGQRFAEHDAMHRQKIQGTLFGFRTNRRIFRAMFHVQQSEPWGIWMSRWNGGSPWGIDEVEFQHYRSLSVRNIISFLRRVDDSTVLRLDPRGHTSIRSAAGIRKELRLRLRRGQFDRDQARAVVRRSRRAFRLRADRGDLDPVTQAQVGLRPSRG